MTDPRFCASCGKPLGPEDMFCGACGAEVIRSGSGRDQGADVSAGPPGDPGRAGGSSSPSPSGPAWSGRTVAIVSAGVGLLILVASYGFFGNGDDGQPTPTTRPSTGTTSPVVTTTQPGTVTTQPGSDTQPDARLIDAIRELQQVGDFTLVAAAQSEESVALGAVDAVEAGYRAEDGTELYLVARLWASAEQALDRVELTAETATAQGTTDWNAYTILSGDAVVGTGIQVQVEGHELVVWTVGRISFDLVTTRDRGIPFIGGFGYRATPIETGAAP